MASRSMSHNKSSKGKHEKGRDYISSLPDDVIVRILSFLPTKHAVGTSILARRWQYLFTHLTNLDCDESLMFDPSFSLKDLEYHRLNIDSNSHNSPDHSFPNQQCQSGFKDFVGRVLKLHNSPTINKFRFKCGQGFDCSNVNAWIQIALLRGVEDLDISTYNYNSSILPDYVFTYEKLVVLRLEGNSMKFSTSVQLPNLKTLHLNFVESPGDRTVSSFISGCPILEDLVIKNVWQKMPGIKISSTNLRSLTLDFNEQLTFGHDTILNVTLDLPNLLQFNYVDNLATNYFLKNLNSLEEAHIEVWVNPAELEFVSDSVLALINGVSNAKHLFLDGLMEAFSYCKHEFPVFRNLTKLELGRLLKAEWRDMLCEFLHNLPILEELVFPAGLFVRPKDHEYGDKNFWSKQQKFPVCLSSRLKIVVINLFIGFEEELRIAEYFLKHGKVLKELNIGFFDLLISRKQRRDSMKLMKASKANRNCIVKLA